MRVSIFKNVKAPMPQETELDKIAYMMQFSQEICVRTQIYRQSVEGKDKKKKRKSTLRKLKEMKITRFPAFAPCVIFYGGKSREHVIGLTDLCFLDIDHINEARQIIEAMNILRKDPNVVMVSRSVSNKGLHILIRYRLKDWETPSQRVLMNSKKMQDVYNEVYDYLAGKYKMKLGMVSDYNAAHMEHLYIVSYDPELYYNPSAEALTIDLDEPIIDEGAELSIMNIDKRIHEAERLISKCQLDEAENVLKESLHYFGGLSSDNSEGPK